MKHHLNTLYVSTDGTYLAKEGECIVAKIDGAARARIPVGGLEGIVCIGRVSHSAQVLGHCAANGVAVTYLSSIGRFLARMEGPVSGNVAVRRTQYRWADDPDRCADLAQSFTIGKIANARLVLRRGARERQNQALAAAADRLDRILRRLPDETNVDAIRGFEGDAGRVYWSVFSDLLGGGDTAIHFSTRSRRPPLDPMNAILSFLYTLLVHDVRGALETAGLDPQVGYLHRDRPGRPSLALDMMEEFRPVVVDRLALSLVNRGQVRASGFKTLDGGGVVMNDATRRTVIDAWQSRKKDTLRHPFLGETVTLGLLWHLQALLLKRYMRGDLDGYPPCLWR